MTLTESEDNNMALLSRIENGFYRIVSGAPPKLDTFQAQASEDLQQAYQGKSAALFFSTEGRIVEKWLHYLPIYDQLLGRYAGTDVKMIEIGVFNGGSLVLWRRLLGGKATIFGIDINPACAAYDDERASVRIGSQDDPQFLRNVVAEMGGVDIVLDDGSHVARHQRASFKTLFPLLNDGGIYVIEDMHTAYWPALEGGLRRRGTAIEFLKDKIDEMHRHYRVRGKNTTEAIPEIDSIQFFDSIAAVKKKKQLPRRSVAIGG